MTDRPMCDRCDIYTNKAQWEQYPHMLEICKTCQSFQDAIYRTIDEHKAKINKMNKLI